MPDPQDLQPGIARLAGLAEQRQLRGVTTAIYKGVPALMVGDTAFVRILEDHTALMHCPKDQKVLLMEISPDLYFETDEHVGQDAMLIRLDRISDEELALRLHDAWMFRAPAHLKRG